MKTGMRLRPQVGGGICLTERNEKKLSKVVIGRGVSLDKSLLMGVFPIRSTNSSPNPYVSLFLPVKEPGHAGVATLTDLEE